MRTKSATLMAGLLGACATPAMADIVVTPRFTGYFDNSTQRQSGVDAAGFVPSGDDLAALNAQLQSVAGPDSSIDYSDADFGGRSSQAFFPMMGASVSISLDPERRTQITATGLYGRGHGTVDAVGTVTQHTTIAGFTADDLFAFRERGRGKFTRVDAELTVQHRLNETFSLIAGVRYERLTEHITTSLQTTGSRNTANLINALFGDGNVEFGLLADSGAGRTRTTSAIYSARFGGAAYVPLGNLQQIYVNGLIQFNHAPADVAVLSQVQQVGGSLSTTVRIAAENSVGPDISVGYIRQLSDTVSFDIRYRGLFYFPVSGPRSFDDPRVNHGLSVGISFAL